MTTDTPTPDPHDRVCCPDDFCTGILNSNGTCGTCDRTYSQYASERTESTAVTSEPSETASHDESPEQKLAIAKDDSQESDEAKATLAGDELSNDERVVCPDDMCTGVIGPDGHCGTCGISGSP